MNRPYCDPLAEQRSRRQERAPDSCTGAIARLCCLGFIVLVSVLFVGYVILVKPAIEDAEARMRGKALIAMEVQDIYLEYFDKHNAPPSTIDDLRPYADKYSRGFLAINSDEWVVLWGTPVGRHGDRVFAYEKNITKGNAGWVFMGGQSGRKMSAKELHEVRMRTDTLHDIGRMYLAYCSDHKKPPSRIEELFAYAVGCRTAYEAVRDGEWVVLWNTMASNDGETGVERPLGYETRLMTEGSGWVLLADGSGVCESDSAYRERCDRGNEWGQGEERMGSGNE